VQILAPCADLTIGHTGNGLCICTELGVKSECPAIRNGLNLRPHVQILAPCVDLTLGHTGNGLCICTVPDPTRGEGIGHRVKPECPASGHTGTVYAVLPNP